MSKDKYMLRKYRIAKEMLKDVVFPKAKVLDIGCYDGYFLSTIPDIDGYGVDTDDEAMRIAAQRGVKVHFPFYWENYDVIVCMDVLEHQQDPEKMVNDIKKWLKTKGAVLISLPNECTLWHRLKVLVGVGIDGTGFAPHYHMHFPTLKQNDEFVSKYFRILKKRYWVYGLPELFAFWPGLFARGVIYVCECGDTNDSR